MIAFLFALVILGVLAYILEHYVPMDPVFRLLVRRMFHRRWSSVRLAKFLYGNANSQ